MILMRLTFFASLGFISHCTIDLNSAVLQYLADHLTTEECRRLVAMAHYKSYEQSYAWDQAERRISKDLRCIDLLHHWNSAKGEGRGETHEALEHRLRQMEKIELADWLGKSVFRELGADLNRSFENDFQTLSSSQESSTVKMSSSTLPENVNGVKWTAADTIMYTMAVILILTICGLCCRKLLK